VGAIVKARAIVERELDWLRHAVLRRLADRVEVEELTVSRPNRFKRFVAGADSHLGIP
jgi:hypothetical protein